VWHKESLSDFLKKSWNPFCVLHYEPTSDLTQEEKSLLTEYLLRGGFLQIVFDFYAAPDVWNKKKEPSSLWQFFTVDLPAQHAEFKFKGFVSSKRIQKEFLKFRYAAEMREDYMKQKEYRDKWPDRFLLKDDQYVVCFEAIGGTAAPTQDDKDLQKPLKRPFISNLPNYDNPGFFTWADIYINSMMR
jgi:hypothetical protein